MTADKSGVAFPRIFRKLVSQFGDGFRIAGERVDGPTSPLTRAARQAPSEGTPMTDETLFAEALEKATADERAEFLNAACDTPEQRARVESLLAAHDRASGFLNRPAVASASEADVTRSSAEADVTRDSEPEELVVDATPFLAPPTRPDSLGRIGHYEVLEILGQGGFGIVYRAFDDRLQKVWAVKVLAPHLAVTSPARKRFLREARSAAAVDHPNVVQVIAVEEQPLPFLVMEYLPGETLQERLDRTGPVDVSECVRVGRQIAEGLAAAHAKGLIHRDIKPSNILVDRGPSATVKITDFGLARAADDASLTRSGAVAGTPMYMAPEQARGETLDHRADLFSLGSVLYQMASGRPPFRASSTLAVLKRVAEDTPRPIREVIPEVPDWFCRIVEKLHEKDPDKRFQSAREVADLLADCEKQLADGNRLTDTSRIPVGKRMTQPKRKGVPTWVWVLVALAGMCVVGCVGLPVLGFLSWLTPLANRQGDMSPGVPHEFSGPADGGTMLKDEGFTPLFNGKDLSGWKEFPAGRGSWTVENGVLVGKGKPSHLFTERGDFTNFHLRMELRVRGGTKAGALGVYGRVPVEDPGMAISPHDNSRVFRQPMPMLYDDTAPRPKDPPSYREQPLIMWGGDLKGEKTNVNKCPADEWMTYEVIQDGEHVTFRLAEKDVSHSGFMYAGAKTVPGHLALQMFDAWSVVEIRKIEIKELPLVGGPVDTDRIKGEWLVTAGEADGITAQARPGEEAAVRFGNGDFAITSPGLQFAGTYRVDPARRELFLQSAPDPVLLPVGYRFDADRLRLTFPAGVFPELVPSDRVRSQNNLKQLGIALHNYSEVNDKALPPAALTAKGKGGTPLLSWRVALLPFLEHDDLYRQFKLDEPWDSEHNKKLIEKMPKQFVTPGTNAPAGQTHYRAFTGPGTVFETDKDGRPVATLTNIPDGTSNTLLFVEAAEPVIWTKPDDLPFDPKKLPKLGVSPGGVNVVFVDGSAQTLISPLKDDVLRAMITRNGGEVIELPIIKPNKSSGGTTLECVRPDFRPLFNGTDPFPWVSLRSGGKAWAEEGGELVGRNRTAAWYKSGARVPANFHLRAEVKLSGTGEAGLYFAEDSTAPPSGMGVDLTSRKEGRFGSLVADGKVASESSEQAAPKKWFRLEVIANARQWRVLIDGKQVAQYGEPDGTTRGKAALLLQQAVNPQPSDDLVIRFRKIEIRELPASEVAERKKEVEAKEKLRNAAKGGEEVGKASKLELFTAEAELAEAQVKLAEAEGNAKGVTDHLEALVKYRQEERELFALRVKAELDRQTVLDAADARLADAKARLAKARTRP